MEHIIQQILLTFTKEITKKIYSGGISDIDALSSDVLNDCKSIAITIIEAACKELNSQIRTDKDTRKTLGLSIKEKDRSRKLLTELGTLNLERDYYYNCVDKKYVSLLDQIIGLQRYERIGDTVSAKLVMQATDVSYAKSADIVTGGVVSKQTVKNHIMKLNIPENEPIEIGKWNKVVPLVTVTEGVETVNSGRNRTINPMRFVDETFSPSRLWKSAEGYIDKVYDIKNIETIYVHGDGGKWIKNGLDSFRQTIHVMDGYHVEKCLKKLSNKCPSKNLRYRINLAIKNDDKKAVDNILQEMYEDLPVKEHKEISDIGKYLINNWESIRRRKTLNISGSCTEAQVSHVLSSRFSRNPLGWSEKGLGKLTKLRIYVKNGGVIKNTNFKNVEPKEKYIEYADRFIDETIGKSIDCSMFEPVGPIFDKSRGTQVIVNSYGKIYDKLIN